MVTENTTPNRGYQEPAVGNTLEVDVGRLIAALRAIDTDMASAMAAIVAKAGLSSPAFIGTPTAPTAAPGTDSGQLATTAFVKTALAALVGLAPEALDTIEELAAASESNSDLIDLLEAAVALKADAATTTASLAGKEDLLSAATSDNTLDDTDEVVYLTGTTRKRGTLAGLITSIFKTTRTIANGQFAAATFKLFNAAGTPRALSFITTALTADRTVTAADANMDLGLTTTAGFDARVPTAIAARARYDIGSYTLAWRNTQGQIAAGDIVAGSSLTAMAVRSGNALTPYGVIGGTGFGGVTSNDPMTGSWMFCGSAASNDNTYPGGLWKRIS